MISLVLDMRARDLPKFIICILPDDVPRINDINTMSITTDIRIGAICMISDVVVEIFLMV